ncbi:MAG: flagellar FlbD family protein [Candidatus Riflebacteria bacterium]|nr:flagellar FlbD family protein [Candidatus Riflebacteria bacterium]
MIRVTRLNGSSIRINAELIESVEAVPDTVITLIRGKTLMVKESVDEVVRRVLRYQRIIHTPRHIHAASPDTETKISL